jgi:hypothetical protein
MDARNDKPPFGGLTRLSGSLYARVAVRRRGSLTALTSLSTSPYVIRSGTLVGETTHRATLNLNRGSQPLGARRIVGKRKWHTGKPVKSSRQQGGSVSHLISARSTLGVLRLNRAEFTISHQF